MVKKKSLIFIVTQTYSFVGSSFQRNAFVHQGWKGLNRVYSRAVSFYTRVSKTYPRVGGIWVNNVMMGYWQVGQLIDPVQYANKNPRLNIVKNGLAPVMIKSVRRFGFRSELFVLIRVKTVYKGYQQTTKYATLFGYC